ncbi:MAG TPA: IclR family transcriptional regulator [Steroidobacter sp.]|uniref:IclR family transcriptional regulator n=1 Tax=Steroidobacter sp. TaxID=1978227 RepID=UPI002EDA8A5B
MSSYIVKPLLKAIEVLKCVGQLPEPQSLKEIALRVGLPKTSVFRYLRTFEAAGMIVHDQARDLYRIDTRIIGMINLGSEMERLRKACLPHMQTLCRLSGETVNLGVMEGSDIVYLEILQSPRAVKLQARVGGRHPIHTTSIGKVMLANLPGEARTAALPRVLRQRTRRSILERQSLFVELDKIYQLGYAEDDGENEDGALCLGAPIFDASGAVVAGLSITAPTTRISKDWKREMTSHVLAEAQAISTELGYVRNSADSR